MKEYDLIIIGAGASGMLTAIECKERGLKDILVIDKNMEIGGALTTGNYKIFKDAPLTGQDYLKTLRGSYEQAGIETLLNTMVINITPDDGVLCTSPEHGVNEYFGKKILIANGGKEKGRMPIKMPGDRVAGTFSLATAKSIVSDANLQLGSAIAILGTSHLDSIEQTFLEKGITVNTIINPSSDSFSFAPAKDATVYNGYELCSLLGDGRLHSLVLKKDRQAIEIACDTLLFATGWVSDGLVAMRSQITINPESTGPKVNSSYETSREGIFASGNAIYIHDYMEEIIEEAKKVADSLC